MEAIFTTTTGVGETFMASNYAFLFPEFSTTSTINEVILEEAIRRAHRVQIDRTKL